MTSLASGSSGSGSITQLIATGALDKYLSEDAKNTFWRTKYVKSTNFAMESVAQPWGTQVAWGSESQITLNRNGDLCYFQYVCVDLPGLYVERMPDGGAGPAGAQFPSCSSTHLPCKSSDERAVEEYLGDGYTDAGSDVQAQMMTDARSQWMREKLGQAATFECCDNAVQTSTEACDESGQPYAYFCNNIGQHLIKRAQIVIGGSPVDALYSDLMNMMEELTGKAGRRLSEMTGKRYSRTQLMCDSRKKRTLWIPLPWWYTLHSGQALPLASLQFHGVQLHVTWAPLSSCIVTSCPGLIVKNAATGAPITSNDLTSVLDTTYIFLDQNEREKYASTAFEMLILQNQAFTMRTTTSTVMCNLSFNHPVTELMFAVRRKCHEDSNNWFNYSGLMNLDPIEFASLYLNNQPRFSERPGTYFRLVQPYQHHSSIPDSYVYNFCFALFPEGANPSGSCNMSRIDHCELRMKLQDGLEKDACTIMVFARNWNVLRFRDGLGGIAYAT